MHLAEGTVPLGQALAWSAVALPTVIWSLRGEQRARQEDPTSSILMAGATSLLFAGTLLPLPVPVVGATSHICLTPILALIVGVRRIVWPTFFVLLLHAAFFAHGGLTTLGVNTLSLGLIGPATTVGLWRLFRRLGLGRALGLAVACGLGDLSVYVTDALVLAAALSDVTAPATTFVAVLLGFAPVQVPLAVLEGVVAIGIVRLLATRRPDLLPKSLLALQAGLPGGARSALLLLVIGLPGCAYEGIDGSVFGETAEGSGQPPTDSLLDFSQGELGLAMSILILFGMGFVAGRSWYRLLDGERDAPPR